MNQLTFSLAELPANHSPSPDSEADWATTVATYRSNFCALLTEHAPAGFFGRTSPEFCPVSKAGILAPSSQAWSNSGIAAPGECWTLNISEWPNDAAVCSLSDILEAGEVPRRFFLSARACKGILRRAAKRGKALPERLAEALKAAASAQPT